MSFVGAIVVELVISLVAVETIFVVVFDTFVAVEKYLVVEEYSDLGGYLWAFVHLDEKIQS